jgi:hypothetical protein
MILRSKEVRPRIDVDSYLSIRRLSQAKTNYLARRLRNGATSVLPGETVTPKVPVP